MDLTLGALPTNDNRCTFRVWAPKAKQVEVHLLSPQDRFVSLASEDDGLFAATIDGVPPGSLYRYRLDGQLERPDPASRHQPEGVHGPSEVVARDFAWTDAAWSNRPLEHYVIYELHVGTFTPEGTFDAIIPRLDDLVELGITALELMPLAQFPGSRNWGYDGAYIFAAQSTYGGPDGMRRLVDACHRRGVAVILDVVYNHLGPEGNYLNDFAQYFSQHLHTDWGPALNFDGHHSDQVRSYFLENALSWFRDFHLDGLRLDAINWIRDHGPKHFLEELGEVIAVEEISQNRPHYLIAESLLNDPKVLRPREQHGYGMHAQWCDDFHHSLHALLTRENHGYYQDFGDLEHLARAYRQGYHFEGQRSRYRQKSHGRPPHDLHASQFVIYSQNHDQTGNRAGGERLSRLINFEALKIASAATLLSPNIPLLFMGEEYGETNSFPFFISHGNAKLVDAVRKGRLQEFAAHGWTQSPPDPQDEATFRGAILNWECRDQGQHHQLLGWYRALLQLRKTLPAFARLDFLTTKATAFAQDGILLLERGEGEQRGLVILHFSGETKSATVPVPKGRWQKRLDSADAAWGGTGSDVANEIERKWSGQLGGWQAIALERS